MPEEESVISAGMRLLLATALTALGFAAPAAWAPAASARPAAEAGLVDVRSVVPDAVIDLRYATSDNFVGQRLYPSGAPCLVHESMAPGLAAAAAALRPQTPGVLGLLSAARGAGARCSRWCPTPTGWPGRPPTPAATRPAGRWM